MIPYFAIFAVLAVFSILDILDGGKEMKQRAFFLFFSFLFLFAAFRAGDQDYQNYVAAFREAAYVDVLDKSAMEGTLIYFMEPGYRLLNKLLSLVTSNPLWIVALTAFVSLFLNFKCYREYSPYFLLTVLLYFVHTFLLREMIQIRSGVACAICLYSVRYGLKGDVVRYLLLVVLAGLFHTISWAFLLVYPVYWSRLGRRTWGVLGGISLGVALFFPLGHLLALLPPIPVFEKILIYVADSYYNQPLGVFTNPTMLKTLAVAGVGLYFYRSLGEQSKYFRLLFNMYMIGTCWLLLFNDFSIIAARVATLFTISEVILIPMFLSLLSQNFFHRLLFWSVLIVFCVATLSLNLYVGNVLPYKLSLF